MNTMQMLREPHDFRNGHLVSVYLKKTPHIIYDGTIYGIYNKPLQQGIKNSPMIDYFYIAFDKSVYNDILQRGLPIIYNGREHTISEIDRNEKGEITNIYIYHDACGIDKTPIQMENIDAVLIWRVAYTICKRSEEKITMTIPHSRM